MSTSSSVSDTNADCKPISDSSNNKISTADILEVAKLSRLAVDNRTATAYAADIDKILDMMQTISEVDTEGLAPLSNIHNEAHSLRPDVPNTDIHRDLNQSIAPAVAEGLYLVPQVLD